MAFAQVEALSSDDIATDIETPITEANEAQAPDVEIDSNEMCSVAISFTGEGKIETTSEMSFEVPAGTVFKVTGNELYIGDKSYIAKVNRGYFFKD